MKTLTIGRGNFNGVAYDSEGRFLVSLNSRNRVRFWDLATYSQRLAFSLPPQVSRSNDFSLAGNLLALRHSVWDITPAWDYVRQTTWSTIPTISCQKIALEGEDAFPHLFLAVGWDGKMVVGTDHLKWRTVGGVEDLCIWDTSGKCRSRLRVRVRGMNWGILTLTPDTRTLATSSGKEVLLLDLSSGDEIVRLRHSDYPKQLRFSPMAAGWPSLPDALCGCGIWPHIRR
jgi:WD40 repeat protein